MNCPECDDRLSVTQTVPWDGQVLRRRRCSCCEKNLFTVETFTEGWPAGFFTKELKAARRPVKAGGRDDHFNPNAGADLAGVMNLFARPVASAQQLDPD